MAATTVAGALIFAADLRAAAAAPPVCFPERTVSEVIVLRDDRLQPIGGLYTGTVVRLREDPTVASGKWADVEISAPIVVGGRVERDRLLVFAGADLEVEPGLAWVLAGAPLAILSGDAQRARVIVASPRGEKPQLRPVRCRARSCAEPRRPRQSDGTLSGRSCLAGTGCLGGPSHGKAIGCSSPTPARRRFRSRAAPSPMTSAGGHRS